MNPHQTSRLVAAILPEQPGRLSADALVAGLVRDAGRAMAELEEVLTPSTIQSEPSRWERIARAWATRRSFRPIEGPSFTVWDGRRL